MPYLSTFDSVPQFPPPRRITPMPVEGDAPRATLLSLLAASKNPRTATATRNEMLGKRIRTYIGRLLCMRGGDAGPAATRDFRATFRVFGTQAKLFRRTVP